MRARHDAGRGERQGDGEEGAQRRGADVARGQFEIAVDRGEGRRRDPDRIDEAVGGVDQHDAERSCR